VVVNGVLSNGAGLLIELPQGAPCTADLDCASLHCVDGYCCDSPCAGGCDVCAQAIGASANGTCTVIPSGSPGANPSCALFVCDGTAASCPTACTTDAGCVASAYCAADDTCHVQKGTGGTCAAADCKSSPCRECASDYCVDGVCCDTACAGGTGDCQACSVAAGAAVDGTCGALTGTACDDGNPCTNTDICTAGACGGAAYTCGDGLACTTDTCNGDGTCTFTLTDGNCSIGGACYAAGAPNPGNQCQQCTPSTSQAAWSDKANDTACNDGHMCTRNDVCTGGVCGGTAFSCSDGLACTTDSCNGNGCTFTITAGNCSIGGACYAAGATNPGNQCQQCTPSTGQAAWSDKANGTACGDGRSCTRNDVCTGGVCGGTAFSCSDGLACTTDSCNGNGCTFTITAGNCAIGGACYAAGATNPGNQCQQCMPSTSQTTWSPKTGSCDADAGATGSDGPDAPSVDGTLQIRDAEMELAQETGQEGGQQAGLDGPGVSTLDSGTSDATSDVATIGVFDATPTGGDTPAVVSSPDGPVSSGVPDGGPVSVDTLNATADAMPIRQDGSQVVAADTGGIDGPAATKAGSSGGCGCAVGGTNSSMLSLPMCILPLLCLLRAKHSRRRNHGGTLPTTLGGGLFGASGRVRGGCRGRKPRRRGLRLFVARQNPICEQ
jgi:hypothetical protein